MPARKDVSPLIVAQQLDFPPIGLPKSRKIFFAGLCGCIQAQEPLHCFSNE